MAQAKPHLAKFTAGVAVWAAFFPSSVFSSSAPITNVAKCMAAAASRYHVSMKQIDVIINNHLVNPSGIGVMGIEREWVPYLSNAGINPSRLNEPCQNIVAGAWILAYTQMTNRAISVYSGGRNLPQKAIKWQPAIEFYSKESGVPVNVINAVIYQESRFNEMVKSPVGAIGLMQLMPSTAADLGVNPYDPNDNIRGGVTYLRDLSRQFNGNLPLVLAAYNAGANAVNKYGGIPPYNETQNYVSSIMSNLGGSQKND